MKILLTADPEIPVPPENYGGIERIVNAIVEGLVEKGHAVTLCANRASNVPCTLVGWKGRKSQNGLDTVQNTITLSKLVWQNRFDVVHSFGRLAYMAPVMPLAIPKIMSYQREPSVAQVKKAVLLSRRGTLHFTGCSNYITNQIRSHAPATTIYNCTPFEKFDLQENMDKTAPLVFLGRIEDIKGVAQAMEVARRAGKELIIAGNIPAGKERYFHDQVKPLLNENITYIGAVNDARKNELLGKAAALLMPIQWNEPFGIVMIEAMACGTPVIGLAKGSVSEVVETGQTGFVCQSTEEMAGAVGRLEQLKRNTIKERAEQRFSTTVVVGEYLRLYQEVIERNRETQRKTIKDRRAALLPEGEKSGLQKDEERKAAREAVAKTVVLLAAGQPSTNPRVVKEYLALKQAGYQAKVIYPYVTGWAVNGDKELFQQYPLKNEDFILVGGSPDEKRLLFYGTRVVHKLARILSKKFLFFSAMAESRIYWLAKRTVRRLDADLLIAHSVTMIAVAAEEAAKKGTKAAVDFEDFYSGQWQRETEFHSRSAYLEKKYLPKLRLSSAASPLIAEVYARRFALKPVVINNVFSVKHLVERKKATARTGLKLFWFSQTVGKNRGLQDVIAAMGDLPGKDLSLTIMGNCPPAIKELLMASADRHRVGKDRIHFLEPQPLDNIFTIAGQHDIGLALEVENTENRKICLTNKLFTYLLSGLAVIATDTPAQKTFMAQHSSIGAVYPAGNHKALCQLLQAFLDDNEFLAHCQEEAVKLAREIYNWEAESGTFLSYINSCFS